MVQDFLVHPLSGYLPYVVDLCTFVGSNIAKALAGANSARSRSCRVQISSRNPQKIYDSLREQGVTEKCLLPPLAVDITKPDTLGPSFEGADVVVSLVGIMHGECTRPSYKPISLILKHKGSPQDFEDIQWKGAENVARAAKNTGAKLIHFSAIGADAKSSIPYVNTKAFAEKSVFEICPDATVIRPSLVFGPGDDFFNVSRSCLLTHLLDIEKY